MPIPFQTLTFNLVNTENHEVSFLLLAVFPECGDSPPSSQLPLAQPAQTTSLPTAPHQPAHACVSERWTAHPAPSADPRPAGPAHPLIGLTTSSAAFFQPATQAVFVQSGAGMFH